MFEQKITWRKAPPWSAMTDRIGETFLVAIECVRGSSNVKFWSFCVVILKKDGDLEISNGYSNYFTWYDVNWYVPIAELENLPIKDETKEKELPLKWLKGVDDQDNSVWSAQSSRGYAIFENHRHYYLYQIIPFLKNNKLWWAIDNSSPELVDRMDQKEFATLDKAMEVCDFTEQSIIQDKSYT